MNTNFYKQFLFEADNQSTLAPASTSQPQQTSTDKNKPQPATLGGLSKDKGTQARIDVKSISKNISQKYTTDSKLKVGDVVNYVSKSIREGEKPAPKQAYILAMPGDKFKFKEDNVVDVNDNEVIIIDPTSAEQWKAMRIANTQQSTTTTQAQSAQPTQNQQKPVSEPQQKTTTTTQAQSAQPATQVKTESLESIYFNNILFTEQAFVKTPVKVSIISQGRVAGPDGQQKDQWVYTVGPKAGEEVPLDQTQAQDQGDNQEASKAQEAEKQANQEAESAPDIKPETKKALSEPKKEFDVEKRYYLNLKRAGGLKFDLSNLKDKEIRASFMSGKNITKAASDLEDYANSIAGPIEQQETPTTPATPPATSPASTTISPAPTATAPVPESNLSNLKMFGYNSLFENTLRDILQNHLLIEQLQQSYTFTGIGEIPGPVLARAVAQAVIANAKEGATIDDIQEIMLVKNVDFAAAKQNITNNKIPININIKGVLTTQAQNKQVMVNNKPHASSSKIIESLTKYFNDALSKAENEEQFITNIKSNTTTILTELQKYPDIKALIDTIDKPENIIIDGYDTTLTKILASTVVKKVNIKGSSEIHAVIYELFCNKPNNYILYLTETQWQDVALGGKVVGSLLGVLSGIAKSF